MNNGLSVASTYTLYPETRPLIPSSYDDEFDGPYLHPKWEINSAVTYPYQFPQLYFQQSSILVSGSSYGDASPYEFRLAQPCPPVNWAISSQLTFWQKTNTTTPVAGLFVKSQTGASYHHVLSLHTNGNLFADVYRYNPDLSLNIEFAVQQLLTPPALANALTANPNAQELLHIKFQIRCDKTTLYFDYGNVDGQFINFTSDLISSFFVSSPVSFGIVMCSCSSVDWFRFRNTSTTNDI